MFSLYFKECAQMSGINVQPVVNGILLQLCGICLKRINLLVQTQIFHLYRPWRSLEKHITWEARARTTLFHFFIMLNYSCLTSIIYCLLRNSQDLFWVLSDLWSRSIPKLCQNLTGINWRPVTAPHHDVFLRYLTL